MKDELSSAAMQALLGINRVTLNDLVKRGIAVRGAKRGTYAIVTVTRYAAHLREQAAGRGGEASAAARARLGEAQADLAAAKAAKLRGELVEASEVEAKWTAACRAIRGRVLGVADRMADLPARQHAKLATELRAALSDLSDA